MSVWRIKIWSYDTEDLRCERSGQINYYGGGEMKGYEPNVSEEELHAETELFLASVIEAMNRPYAGTLLSDRISQGASVGNHDGLLSEDDIQTTEQILKQGKLGYAYLYQSGIEPAKQFVFSMTPENIANFIGSHLLDARKIVLTDQMDCLILDTIGSFIDHCPDKKLLFRITPLLVPMMQLEKTPDAFPIVAREVYDTYFEALSMTELQQEDDLDHMEMHV